MATEPMAEPFDDFMARVVAVIPTAELDEDDDGQIVINTHLKAVVPPTAGATPHPFDLIVVPFEDEVA